MEWTKPDATPEQLAADTQQCEQAASREVYYRYPGYTAFGPWVRRDAVGRPFVFQPAGTFYDPYSDRYLDQSRFTNFCMRAKGYEFGPVTK